MKESILQIVAAVVLTPALVSVGFSQPGSFEAKHQQALRANPHDIHLRISIDSDRNVFRIGESIRVKYEFTADVSGKYVAGVRQFDPSQRSVLESFVTDRPQDASDPLREYWEFYEALTGFHFSSGRPYTLRLDSQPQFDSLELTHYLRFEKPGIYHLFAVTRSALLMPIVGNEPTGPPIASENVIELRLLPPDQKSNDAQVEEIIARAHQPSNPRFTVIEAFQLFEINSTKARNAALSLDTNWNGLTDVHLVALATLIAAPTHEEAIRLLNGRLENPKLVADEHAIVDLALVNFQQKNPHVGALQVHWADPLTLARWRSQFASEVAVIWHAVASKLKFKPAAVRASTIKSLDAISSYCFGPESLPISFSDRDRVRSAHLASLADLPVYELESDLLNFHWLETLPNDQVLAVLSEIYANAPAPQADFIREVTLQEISKRDAPKAQELFTSHVIRLDEPFDLYRIRYMKVPPGRELDAELIRILEDRWTERMSRVAPMIGLYATDSILPRVKKVYEVWGPSWPCSIEAGLLTYFLRVDPGYGTEKLGPALAAYNDMGNSDCRVSLLVDMALLRNPPELKPFVSAALNDSRPLVAAAGAHVTGFETEDKVRMGNLVSRLRLLHEEWLGFDEKSKSDTDYMHRWQSGYDELERMITIDLVNANDSRENSAAWRSALDVCVTEFCRKEMKDRLARSSF